MSSGAVWVEGKERTKKKRKKVGREREVEEGVEDERKGSILTITECVLVFRPVSPLRKMVSRLLRYGRLEMVWVMMSWRVLPSSLLLALTLFLHVIRLVFLRVSFTWLRLLTPRVNFFPFRLRLLSFFSGVSQILSFWEKCGACGTSLRKQSQSARMNVEGAPVKSEDVSAVLQYAASFRFWWRSAAIVKSLRRRRKKSRLLRWKLEAKKHRAWCAATSRDRCMRCGRNSTRMRMQGKCERPRWMEVEFNHMLNRRGKAHLGGHDTVRRVDPNGPVQKMFGLCLVPFGSESTVVVQKRRTQKSMTNMLKTSL